MFIKVLNYEQGLPLRASYREIVKCAKIMIRRSNIMSVKAFEAIVEKGQIKLPVNVQLADKAKVYVVVAEEDIKKVPYIASPRLARREQAADFIKEMEV